MNHAGPIPSDSPDSALTLFLAGDVMTGRGIDQVLPRSVHPQLHEQYVKDARRYVEIAEAANGPIPLPVSYRYIWGDVFGIWDHLKPHLKLINLETSITTSADHWPNKGIHYRMHPRNIPCLTAAGIDYAGLANNHVLDWGYAGLEETIRTLDEAGIAHSGAGANLAAASAPAVLAAGGARVLVFAAGLPSSGIAGKWAATPERPGVFRLRDLSPSSREEMAYTVQRHHKPGDIVIVSIHWGSNWGYAISQEQRAFAHYLIDSAQVDLVYGHSSHHPLGIEVYRDRLILYGCGDLINDYEGIGGEEEYRSDLRLMYFPVLNASSGQLLALTLAPVQMRRFRLHRADAEQSAWLANVLNREGMTLGSRVVQTPGNLLKLAP